ncbi:MAG TPA: hypothetical protein VMF08_03825 [Candidatus Sulfotelmatobacter sp.]|nr:hypothetical protein [Candidatus Sulfotelmatobacter sp.]
MLKLTRLLVVTILAGTSWPAAAQTRVATPIELQSMLRTNTQGAVVSLCGIDPDSCPSIPMSQAFAGGKLIFSDSPESPTNAGILYMDTNLPPTVAGAANRVFVYHVNASFSETMRFSVLIRNNGKSAAALRVRRTGIAGPSANYLHVGETAVYRWLTSAPCPARAVAPGQTIRLDTHFDSIQIGHGGLANGIWDYTFDQPHAIIICALHSNDVPDIVGPTLAVLARDIHDRGTFAYCDKLCAASARVIVDPAAGVRQFPIGGGSDVYVTGWDYAVFPPTAATNDGNYGVLYTVKMNTASDDSRALALALLMSPQGGPWCGAVNAAPGLLAGGTFFIPSTGSAVSDPSSATIEGEYFPGAPKEVWFQFMPAGASSFPVYVMTVPFSRDR